MSHFLALVQFEFTMNVRNLSFDSLHTLKEFLVNINTLVNMIPLQVYTLMSISTFFDPPKLVNHLIFSFAILGWCSKNESKISLNFTLITTVYQEYSIIGYRHHLTGVSIYMMQ